jgi:CheY-like chemotaxis protein
MSGSAEGKERRRVLILDDDKDWIELVQLYFLDRYEVVALSPDTDIVDRVLSFRPHAMILDLVMPTIDGFGMLERLKDGGYSEVPTILLTGWKTQEVEQCAASLGCKAVLAKPVELGLLAEVVSNVIGDA